jgi:hypothetical protein
MRMLTGLILGVFLTVATAWWVDQHAAPGEPRMVDWQVVGRHVDEAKVQLRDGWDKLTASLDRNRSEHARTDSPT